VAGTYSTALGAQSSLVCASCVAGTYSTASGAAVASACVQCVGGWCVGGFRSALIRSH
jgi:hypothetical protein